MKDVMIRLNLFYLMIVIENVGVVSPNKAVNGSLSLTAMASCDDGIIDSDITLFESDPVSRGRL